MMNKAPLYILGRYRELINEMYGANGSQRLKGSMALRVFLHLDSKFAFNGDQFRLKDVAIFITPLHLISQ